MICKSKALKLYAKQASLDKGVVRCLLVSALLRLQAKGRIFQELECVFVGMHIVSVTMASTK